MSAELAEQHGECRLHHHERAGAGLPGQLGQGAVRLRVQPQRHGSAPVAGHRGAREVDGQRQLLREVRQLSGPVVELAGHQRTGVVLIAEQSTVPEGVVGVLDGQLGPLRGAAGQPGAVGGLEVVDQRAHRPAVGRDVVLHQQQHVLLGAGLEQHRAQRRFGGQVEGRAGPGGQFGVQLLGRAAGERDDRQLRAGLADRQHPLVRASVLGGEDGAQALVPGDHVGQRLGERRPFQGAGQPDRVGEVVGGAGSVQLGEEPESLLPGGERDPLRPRAGHQLLPGRLGAVQGERQGERGGRFEQGADRQLDAEPGAQRGDHPAGQQRVPAEREEVLVGADLVEFQHLGEQRAQQRLALGGRGPPLAAQRAEVRHRQGLAVHLAVGGQRQRRHRYQHGRDHVVGQRPGQFGADGGRVGPAGEVGDQPGAAGRVPGDGDHRVGHAGDGAQRGLDLAGLDPVAADLDLVVDPLEELQLPVRPVHHPVAGAVHPGAGLVRVRVGDERSGGAPRVVQVAAADAAPADVQLAGLPGRYGLQRVPEDVQPGVADRAADRGAHRVQLRRGADQGVGDVVRALGRPEGVDQRDAGPQCEPAAGQVGGHRLAGDHQLAQCGQRGHRRAGLPGVQGGAQQRGDDLQHGDALGVGEREQRAGVGRELAGDHPQPPARDQRAQHLPDRDVEGDRGVVHHGVGLGQLQVGVLGEQVVDHAVAVHHGALGPAGGARGVDDVRQLGGAPGGRQQFLVAGVVEDQDGGAALGQCAEQGVDVRLLVLAVQQDGGARGLDQCRAAGGRGPDVQRQPGRARAEHAEDGGHEAGAGGGGDGHQPVRPGARGDQSAGQGAGPGDQLGVVEPAGVVLDGGRTGPGQGEFADPGQDVGEHLGLLPVAVPPGEDVLALGRRQGGDPADRQLGGDGGELGEVAEQGVAEEVQALLRVAVGVAVDPQLAALLAAVQEQDLQVRDGAGGQVADPGAAVAEGELAAGLQHVDGRAEAAAGVAGQTEVAADRVVPVALVAQRAAQGGRDLGEQAVATERGVGGDRQRQEVGAHAGDGLCQRGGPGGDGQGQHDPVGAGQLGQAAGGCADQQGLPGDPLGPGGVLEPGDGVGRDQAGAAQGAAGGRAEVAGEHGGLDAVGQLLGPVGAVALVGGGGEVVVLLGEQLGEGRVGGRLGVGQVVLGGEPRVDQGAAEAVHQDVVGLHVQPGQFGADQQQGGGEGVGTERGRELPVGVQERLGGGERVRLAGQVEHRQRALVGRFDELHRLTVPLDEAHPQRLGAVLHALPGGPQPLVVQRAGQFQAVRHGEHRVARVELLGEPHLALGGGQRQFFGTHCFDRTRVMTHRHLTPVTMALGGVRRSTASSASAP